MTLAIQRNPGTHAPRTTVADGTRMGRAPNVRVRAFLKRIDEAEACREAGCPRCGGDCEISRR